MQDSTNFAGLIRPTIALALLESLRAADMPEDRDALHETDLPLSLRRRLGLTGVVEKQIKRYSELRDRKDRLSAQELARLLQLISRRDDANAVFTEAGHRLATRDMRKGGLGRGVTSHAVPKGARQKLALRQARRLARDVSPGSKVLAGGRPPTLVIERCLPARAVNGGGGCSLLSGAIRSILDQYRVDDIAIVHTACEGHAEERCVWRLEANDGQHAAGEEQVREILDPETPAPEIPATEHQERESAAPTL